MKLMRETRDYWHDVENLRIRKYKPPTTDWEDKTSEKNMFLHQSILS